MVHKSENITGGATSRINLIFPVILFFLYSFFFLLLFRKELFFNQFNGPVFIGSPEYFSSMTEKPGGIVSYAANYLIRFYRIGSAGPFILSTLFIIILLLLEKIACNFNPKTVRYFTILVPSCLILALQTDMDHHLGNSLGYLLALFFFFICTAMRERSFIAFVILFPIAFLISGFFSFVFAGMYFTSVLVNLKRPSKFILAGTVILMAVIVPVLSKLFFYLQPWKIILLSPLQFSMTGRPPYLFLFVIACSMFLPFIFSTEKPRQDSESRLIVKTVILLLFIISLTTIIHFRDKENQRTARLERFVYEKEWDKVISNYNINRRGSIFDEHYYCLALANQKILCDSLFRIPHLYGTNSLILPREKKNLPRQLYFYYHLGLVREVHHLAYESVVNSGCTPENLRFLLKSNLITGQYAVAEKYINIMKRTCLESTVNKYAAYTKDTSLILSDPEILRKREMLPERDLFIRYDDFQNLELILLSKPDNVIALQYKIAFLMLRRDLESLRYEVSNLLNAGFRNIPLHMEEALLVDRSDRPDLYGDLNSLFRPETEKRFIQYKEDKGMRNLEDIRERWGNTYWYYFDLTKPVSE